jgi:Protein of unknown function (DUF1670)
MNPKLDNLRKQFAPMLDKTLQNALAHRIAQDFPHIGGGRIRNLCADMILEVLAKHLRPRETVQHGQIVWNAISLNDPPARQKRIRDTDLVPVILDLSTANDIQLILDRVKPKERLRQKAIRLCHQAHAQGGLLSDSDLAELLSHSNTTISRELADFERETRLVVPRRATLHDVGSALTHKRIICWKRYAEGKAPDQIARETNHSLKAVDRYLGDFDRVRHCRRLGMTTAEIAFALGHGPNLIAQYLELDQELDTTNQAPQNTD